MRLSPLTTLPAAKMGVLALGMVLILSGCNASVGSSPAGEQTGAGPAHPGCSAAQQAFGGHASGEWLTLAGRVSRILPDDTQGLQHQRFIVRCSGRLTVLIVNDLTYGQRVPVQLYSWVEAHGQYIWNARGGLLHYTHHNDRGGPGGWILYQGRRYALGLSGSDV